MRINADLKERVVVCSDDLPWSASPAQGVERRMLERDGADGARATSIVRFAPGRRFAAHTHGGGEEFLVLEGVFSDEEGDFGPGMYVRNPPGSRHTPRSGPGCTIFVKLWQMDPEDRARVRIDTAHALWQAGDVEGVALLPLYEHGAERVFLLKLAPGARLPRRGYPGGFEFFVLEGTCEDENGAYPAGTWVRNPPGSTQGFASSEGAKLYVKAGHLTQAGPRPGHGRDAENA